MKPLNTFGILAYACLMTIESLGQSSYPYSAPIIYDSTFNGTNRTLRLGTYSNRTLDGSNTANPDHSNWNGSPRTWESYPDAGWDTKYINGININGSTFTDASITAGSNVLTSATANFTAADVNKIIEIYGAGIAVVGGSNVIVPLKSTIVSRQSSTQVTLATKAATTVSGTTIRYGLYPAFTEGHYTSYGFGNYEMNYRLLFPVGYNQSSSAKYPLIVMVHGAGERGNCWGSTCFGLSGNDYGTGIEYRNNDLNLSHGGQPHLNAVYANSAQTTSYFPGFVVFPQNENGWTGAADYGRCITIVDLLVKAYKIDPDRIYIHGLSNGAAAAWEIVAARPDLFACMVPMSATISHSDAVFLPYSTKTPPPFPGQWSSRIPCTGYH